MRVHARPTAARTACALAGLVLVAAGISACGGGDAGGAPDNASKSDFCNSFTKLDDVGSDASTKDQIKSAKDAVDKLEDIGTPSDMSDDARDGYEVLLNKVKDIDDDASESDLTKIFGDATSTDGKKVAAFLAYFAKECAAEISGSE